VKIMCKGVRPVYAATYPQDIDSGADNGWLLTCYTGISQCVTNSNNGTSAPTVLGNVSATESTACMNDPRYMTWRAMHMRLTIAGAQSWYRVDSYWNSSCTKFSSSWGPGLEMSASWISGTDNNGATNKGKTFVFAYGDGSGIQLNHLAFAVGPPTSNSSAGTGPNALTAAPTTYTNSSPNMVNENYCIGTDLLLAGTSTTTTTLSETITNYSDGYRATLTIALETFLAGAAGGWRGVCMVYYSSQYVQANTNGSVCFAASQSTSSGAGPQDFGSGTLMHVPSATWQPPSMTASVTPTAVALTGGKYDITYAPSAVTKYIFTSGYYASVAWYQPKYGSSYTDIARFGKDDYVGSFCMQGSGSSSYFSAPSAALKLSGAAYLAVGMLSLGTALSLAM